MSGTVAYGNWFEVADSTSTHFRALLIGNTVDEKPICYVRASNAVYDLSSEASLWSTNNSRIENVTVYSTVMESAFALLVIMLFHKNFINNTENACSEDFLFHLLSNLNH